MSATISADWDADTICRASPVSGATATAQQKSADAWASARMPSSAKPTASIYRPADPLSGAAAAPRHAHRGGQACPPLAKLVPLVPSHDRTCPVLLHGLGPANRYTPRQAPPAAGRSANLPPHRSVSALQTMSSVSHTALSIAA